MGEIEKALIVDIDRADKRNILAAVDYTRYVAVVKFVYRFST